VGDPEKAHVTTQVKGTMVSKKESIIKYMKPLTIKTNNISGIN